VAGISIIPMWARLAGLAVVLSGTFGVGYHKGSVSRDGDVARALAQAVQSQSDQAATERAREADKVEWLKAIAACNANHEALAKASLEQAATFKAMHSTETAEQKRLREKLTDLENRPMVGLKCEDAVDEAVRRALGIVGGAP